MCLPYERALLTGGFCWVLALTRLATGPIKQTSSNVALRPSGSNTTRIKEISQVLLKTVSRKKITRLDPVHPPWNWTHARLLDIPLWFERGHQWLQFSWFYWDKHCCCDNRRTQTSWWSEFCRYSNRALSLWGNTLVLKCSLKEQFTPAPKNFKLSHYVVYPSGWLKVRWSFVVCKTFLELHS